MKLLPSLTVSMLISGSAIAAPTNEQLYKMLLEMKAEQSALKKEVAASKTRESELKASLSRAQADLLAAKERPGEPLKDDKQKTPIAKNGFFASAGALYAKPLVNASAGFVPIKSNELNYDPGFQVSAGYQAADNLDYGLKYKRFDTDGAVSAARPGITQTTTYTTYKSEYNILDLEIGKQFSLADKVALKVSGGIRAAVLDERFSSIQNQLNNGLTSVATNTSLKKDFWGVGPRISVAPVWKPFGDSFRVFASVGGSFLKGQQHENNTCFFGTSNMCGDANSDDAFVTMIEGGSGLGYTIKGNLVDIDLQAGYQFEHWLTSDQTSNLLFRGFHGANGTVGIKF